ncbi:MAG TPA: helix-turn-helix transcriptional regulator [Isosphaeraceae bacterium]|nr:helix-turn-helix transcriptional regulator [Isosphaeraceae bacterium]
MRTQKQKVPRIGETFYSSIMDLKTKLKNLMNDRGLNGQKLARLSQVSDSEISRILQGKSRPGLDNALRLALALNVSLDYLANDELDVAPAEPADTISPDERKVLSIAQKVGTPESLTILEIVGFLGYEAAMSRLVGAKPLIEIDKEPSELRPPLSPPAALSTRASSVPA